ncbi:MAG: hypothetical protein JOZ72_18175 [Alphaproteobacteria bacterium]|nr:hypothetical protein [Alphaproteobacteria bacterium]
MTKLTIGIGEDFPVDERRAEDAGCRHRGSGPHGHHHDHHGHHAHWHHWVHEYLSRRRKKKEEKKKDAES